MQRHRAKVAGDVFQLDLLAVFQVASRNTRQQFQRLAFFEIEHPPRLHQKPALLMGLMRTGPKIVFPKRVGFAVSQACHGVVVGLQKRLHFATPEMNNRVTTIIGLAESHVAFGH